MNAQAKAVCDDLEACGGGKRWLRSLQLQDVVDHFGGEFVGALGAAPLRYQAVETSFVESHQGLVKGRARDAESSGGGNDRETLGEMTTQHLVAGLEQISGIEERVFFEERVSDGIRVWVEQPISREREKLWIGFAALGHGFDLGKRCQDNNDRHGATSSKTSFCN